MRKPTIENIDINHKVPNHVHLSNKRFKNCAIGMQCRTPDSRITISNLSISDCDATACRIGPVIFVDCVFNNLRSSSPLWISGAAFVRCKITGFINGITAFELPDPAGKLGDRMNRQIYDDNHRIYLETDYAIDMREAECLSVSIRGIPPNLVLANPKYHLKVSFEKTRRALERLGPENPFRFRLETLIQSNCETKCDFTIFTSPNKSQSHGFSYVEDLALFEFIRESDATLGD